VIGIATALTGMSGPPVLIYLMLAGMQPRAVRAILFAFFAACYAATLAAYIAAVGVPSTIWLGAASLIPFAWAGGLTAGGSATCVDAATVLALIVLIATGLYTVVAAARLALS
jgi:uncharacterized membrane protein YfcA